MILADSSVWIDYFRGGIPRMRQLLREEEIVIHPFVKVELALGALKDRHRTLMELDRLDKMVVAEDSEVRQMIEDRKLYSRGIGFVDAHLIASCLMTPAASLWTRDGRLAASAASASVRIFQPPAN